MQWLPHQCHLRHEWFAKAHQLKEAPGRHQEGKLKAAKVQSNRDSLVASINVWKEENLLKGERLAYLEAVSDADQVHPSDNLVGSDTRDKLDQGAIIA